MLDILIQNRRDKKAAKSFFRKVLKGVAEFPARDRYHHTSASICNMLFGRSRAREQTSATARPVSTAFKIVMIWLSLNLLRFIRSPSGLLCCPGNLYFSMVQILGRVTLGRRP